MIPGQEIGFSLCSILSLLEYHKLYHCRVLGSLDTLQSSNTARMKVILLQIKEHFFLWSA